MRSKAACQELAQLIDKFLIDWKGDEVILESTKLRINEEGYLVDPNTPRSKSAYFINRETIAEFADFLRQCGDGFFIR